MFILIEGRSVNVDFIMAYHNEHCYMKYLYKDLSICKELFDTPKLAEERRYRLDRLLLHRSPERMMAFPLETTKPITLTDE